MRSSIKSMNELFNREQIFVKREQMTLHWFTNHSGCVDNMILRVCDCTFRVCAISKLREMAISSVKKIEGNRNLHFDSPTYDSLCRREAVAGPRNPIQGYCDSAMHVLYLLSPEYSGVMLEQNYVMYGSTLTGVVSEKHSGQMKTAVVCRYRESSVSPRCCIPVFDAVSPS